MAREARRATIKWPRPYDPAPLTDETEIMAIKALAAGRANEVQQKLAVAVIVEKFCRAGDPSFWPDSERLSAFAAGKRFVAQQFNGVVAMTVPHKPTS